MVGESMEYGTQKSQTTYANTTAVQTTQRSPNKNLGAVNQSKLRSLM